MGKIISTQKSAWRGVRLNFWRKKSWGGLQVNFSKKHFSKEVFDLVQFFVLISKILFILLSIWSIMTQNVKYEWNFDNFVACRAIRVITKYSSTTFPFWVTYQKMQNFTRYQNMELSMYNTWNNLRRINKRVNKKCNYTKSDDRGVFYVPEFF